MDPPFPEREYAEQDPPTTEIPLEPFEIDDGADEENFHSLPDPEELKVDTPTHAPNGGCSDFWAPFGFLLLLILMTITVVGLSVGLTSDNRSSSKADSHSDGWRIEKFREYLVIHQVSNVVDFEDTKSPQWKALNFMAVADKRRVSLPSGNLQSKSGYNFITRYIMALFYYAMDGARWNYDLRFMSDKDVCDWYQIFAPPVGQLGVLCNQSTKQIVGYSFISNELTGNLPSELSQLTTISYMESIGNNVGGTIPDGFAQLTNLRTMVFAFNVLTGSFPRWLSKMSRLEFFFVSNNLMTGTVPDDFATLEEMAVLALDDNQLTGSIDFLWGMPKLQYAYLEDNTFTGTFPTSIVLTSELLVNLDLSTNKLDGPLPLDLFRLSKLEVLDLHQNDLTGKLPLDPNNDRLEFLALHGNLLTGSIPPSIGSLKGLTHLDLSSNQLTGPIPIDLNKLKDLTYLFLAENAFTPSHIPTFIYAFSELRELSLKSTRRTGTISELLGNMNKLVLLDLDDNELNGQIPQDISFLTDLQFLLLNRNLLSGPVPDGLGDLDLLRFLLLDRNNLTGDLASVCTKDMPVAIADCSEVTCECCGACCTDGVDDCHDYNLIANADPVWEANYDRQFFNFDDETLWKTADDDEFGGTR